MAAPDASATRLRNTAAVFHHLRVWTTFPNRILSRRPIKADRSTGMLNSSSSTENRRETGGPSVANLSD
jgi:hypothetical protein